MINFLQICCFINLFELFPTGIQIPFIYGNSNQVNYRTQKFSGFLQSLFFPFVIRHEKCKNLSFFLNKFY
jgi:hypothetical protein